MGSRWRWGERRGINVSKAASYRARDRAAAPKNSVNPALACRADHGNIIVMTEPIGVLAQSKTCRDRAGDSTLCFVDFVIFAPYHRRIDWRPLITESGRRALVFSAVISADPSGGHDTRSSSFGACRSGPCLHFELTYFDCPLYLRPPLTEDPAAPTAFRLASCAISS